MASFIWKQAGGGNVFTHLALKLTAADISTPTLLSGTFAFGSILTIHSVTTVRFDRACFGKRQRVNGGENTN